MTTFTTIMKYLDDTKRKGIQMLTMEKIKRDHQLIRDAINGDLDVPLHKLLGADPLSEEAMEKLKAKVRADELLAKHKGNRYAASSENDLSAFGRVRDLLDVMLRDADALMKRQARRDAEDNWRQSVGAGPYSDAPIFLPASRSRIN
jgi:hypothetical protein